MKVISYHCGIPKKNTSWEKTAILSNYIQGVNKIGDQGIDHYNFNIIDCDVAVLQGFVHQNSKNLPHLQLRKNVIETQRMKNKRTLIVDSNLFLYACPGNKPHHYLRYSFDGVFRKTGFYFDTHIDPTRWQKISKNLNITVKPMKTEGKHILICLQRNGGWSMGPIDVVQYCNNLITKIQSFTDRPIVVRGHPGDGKAHLYLQQIKRKNVTVSPRDKHICEDLKDAWASVVYNSSPGVASLIEGVPVFQMDPDPEKSMYSEIANTNLKRLENPKQFDRQSWLERISMCHWSFDETSNGEAWQFMKDYVY